MTRGVQWIRKRGDTWPPIAAQLTANGQPIDLSTATAVDAIFYREEESAEVLRLTTDITHPATLGRVQFGTPSAITATAALYSIEYLITWPGPTEQRLPADAAQDYHYLLVRCDRATPAFPAAPFTLVTSAPTAVADDAQQFPVVNMTTAQVFTHTRITPQPDVWFVGTVRGNTGQAVQIPVAATYPATNQVAVDPGPMAPLNGIIYID